MQKITITKKQRILARIMNSFQLFICMPICLITMPTFANHEVIEFSSPDSIVHMPETWVESKITYTDDMPDADIVMVLDQQTYPAFAERIKHFAEKNGINMVLKRGTCGVSAGGLAKKNIDIGGYCCPPGKKDRLPGLEFHTIGIAPISLLVHKDNPINNITLKQAKMIFGGEIFRWSELKTENGKRGKNIPIQVMARLHCKKRPGHWRLILDDEEKFSPRLLEVGTINDMLSQISTNRHAIGYETEWMVEHAEKENEIKYVSINNKSPTEKEALLRVEYPFYRTYTLAFWKNIAIKNPHTDKIIAYMEKLIQEKGADYGFVASSELKKAGWGFKNNELISEPVKVNTHE